MKGKVLTVKEVLSRQGEKVVATYPYRGDLVGTIKGNLFVEEDGTTSIIKEDNGDVVFHAYLKSWIK